MLPVHRCFSGTTSVWGEESHEKGLEKASQPGKDSVLVKASSRAQEERQRVPSGADQDGLRAPKDLRELLQEKAEAEALMHEELKVLDDDPEWQEYRHELEFELDVLRSRYTNSGEKMTPQRIAQFQAHSRKLQHTLMEKAADKAAHKAFLALSGKERDKLRREFQEFESTGALDVPDPLRFMEHQSSELDASFSHLRRALLLRSHDEGRISKEDLELKLAEEDKTVAQSRSQDAQRRSDHERAVASLPDDPQVMPSVAPGVPKDVAERAAIEDRLLALRNSLRSKEMKQLSAQVEREREMERAKLVLEREMGTGKKQARREQEAEMEAAEQAAAFGTRQ
jgi:hypothetical protein